MALQSKPDTIRLLQALKNEAELVSQFVALLGQEQAALAEGTTDPLPAMAEQKGRLAERLEAAAEQRNLLLAHAGLPRDRAGIDAWCARHPQETEIASAWVGILGEATKAKELNRVNGDLITLRMQHNAQALEALRNVSRPLDLYGPDGQSRSPNTSRRINDSA